MEKQIPTYFQDHMPGNVCYGCGADNHEGLQIKSYWEGEESVCFWQPETKYHGWKNILNGGILATLIDCHCMGTAMAHAYAAEGRGLDSEPEYRYATGTLNIKYLKPTSNLHPVELRARVISVKNRVTTLACATYSQGVKTAESEVIAIRVFDGSKQKADNPFFQG
ncbi:MAG: PaaI family thioesterase [Bacteroidota bacterium]